MRGVVGKTKLAGGPEESGVSGVVAMWLQRPGDSRRRPANGKARGCFARAPTELLVGVGTWAVPTPANRLPKTANHDTPRMAPGLYDFGYVSSGLPGPE